MNIHHHPDDSTVMAYAAGALTEGFSLLIAAHMERCARCRERVAEAEALGGELLVTLPPVNMAEEAMADIWQRIETASGEQSASEQTAPRSPANGELPSILKPYVDADLDTIPWRSVVPRIRQYVLEGIDAGRGSVRLLSIAPGTAIPRHTHRGSELTLILRGSYQDEIGRFQRGDLADLDPSIQHQPVADTDEPCICLVATDERLQFSSVFSRMLHPFIGI